MKKNLVTPIVLALSLSACVNADESRVKAMVDDYSMVELVQLGESPKNKFNFADSGASDTQNAVDQQSKKIKNNVKSKTNAIAQSYKTESGALQCVIVHIEGVSVTTLNHEAGHCFSGLIKQYAPKFDDEIDSSDYGNYLFELFAELAAAIRAYNIDGNTKYIDKRIAEIIAKKGVEAKIYKKALIALRHYKSSVLTDRSYKGLSAEKQVISMFSDKDLEIRISRKDYNNSK